VLTQRWTRFRSASTLRYISVWVTPAEMRLRRIAERRRGTMSATLTRRSRRECLAAFPIEKPLAISLLYHNW